MGTEFLRLYHTLSGMANVSQGARTFLITSSTVGEGKSTVAALLSITLGTLRKKTLLIDLDLRRPTIHRMFKFYLEDGVTDVADGSIPQARAYKQTELEFLHVLTAGRLSQNPNDYFESGHVEKILDLAKARFDYIILDCAPVMPVVDALVACRVASSVLMVVKVGETHRELVKEALAMLTKANAPLGGILLNNVSDVMPYHHGHRYAYEYYRPQEPPKA